MKTATWAYWRRILVGNVLASAAVVFAFGGATLRTPVLQLLRSFGLSFLFSCCIAALLGSAMPRLAPRIWRRFVFPFNWIVSAAVMAVLGMAGSVAAITLLIAAGLVDASLFRQWFQSSVRITIAVTITIGLFITAYERMRQRLDAATLALRTKERDEAEARRLAAEAQLASLESRVQPHFLFNTLNSIAALVHDDPAAAERMTGHLASLLRSSLDTAANPVVPLDEELRVVRAYLDIERARFGDRLRFAVDLGDVAAPVLVPRMGLQTLVENSVKYAVSPRRQGASIQVRARTLDRTVAITVEDDGPGFDPAMRPEGHGLALLEARLRMLFGGRANLRVESGAGGSSITLIMPTESPSVVAGNNPLSSS
jgi:two-component system, LytTR family, sensor histidine kinase AlgZ